MEETLITTLRTSLELHLYGIDEPYARWFALQEACQRLEQQIASAPALVQDEIRPRDCLLITSALRRAAHEIQAGIAGAAFDHLVRTPTSVQQHHAELRRQPVAVVGHA